MATSPTLPGVLYIPCKQVEHDTHRSNSLSVMRVLKMALELIEQGEWTDPDLEEMSLVCADDLRQMIARVD